MNVSKIKNKIASEYKINDGEKFNNKKILKIIYYKFKHKKN